MRFFEGCTALITGASSGFGSEFARQLAPDARALVLVARRESRLQELKRELETRHPGLRVRVHAADLARPEEVGALVRRLGEWDLHVNFLVNNAGIGDHGPFSTGDWDKIQAMLDLNVVALTRLTHALLPMLRAGGRGAILNVSSIAGLLPLPHMSVYAATKAYVNSFSDGLRMELRRSGVTVTALLPGPSETEFLQTAVRSSGKPAWDTPAQFTVPAADVVRAGLAAVAADRARVIPGWKVALMMGMAVALPLGIIRTILQRKAKV